MTAAERDHFAVFGFVVLRQRLTPSMVGALVDEADRVVRDATGERYLQHDEDSGGITGHYIPATSEHTPVSLALAEWFAPLAAELVARPVLLALAQHVVFFDAASWHSDTGWADVASVKVAAYLDPLDATNGALRVLPGSHAVAEQHFHPVMHGERFRDATVWRQAVHDVPGHVLATDPGDVIVFDEHLWHASIDGRDRRQWSATYVQDPATPAEEERVAGYLASQFSEDYEPDADPARYPNYGRRFRAVAPRRWVEQLERLGAFRAAAAEEANYRR